LPILLNKTSKKILKNECIQALKTFLTHCHYDISLATIIETIQNNEKNKEIMDLSIQFLSSFFDAVSIDKLNSFSKETLISLLKWFIRGLEGTP